MSDSVIFFVLFHFSSSNHAVFLFFPFSFCLFLGSEWAGKGRDWMGVGVGSRGLFTVFFLCISLKNNSMLKPSPTDCVLRSQFTRVYTYTTLRGQDWHVVTFDFRGKTNGHFTSR